MKKIILTLCMVFFATTFAYAQWATSGSDIYNTNGGNVGIGTSTPLWLLHLQAASPMLTFTKTGILNWTIGNVTGNNFTIMPDSYTGSVSAFNITTIGNVGIGTITPAEKLSIRDPAIPFDAGSGLVKLFFDSGNGGGGVGFEKETFNTGGLRFYTQYGYGTSVEKMRITGHGDVGIGTTSPLSGGGNANWLTLNGVSTYGGGLISSVAGVTKGYAYYDNMTNSMDVQGAAGIDVTLQPASVVALTAKAGGNVGIGKTNPDYKLDVNGTVSSGVKDYSINSATYQLTNQSNVDGISGVSPTGAFRWYTNPNSSYYNGFLYQLRVFDAVNGESGGLLTIRGDGSVGIGTATPDATYKLSVNGFIRTKEVKVEAGWSDYVFDKGYALKPLTEVADYISKNKHLPDVPSAAEVEKNGVKVGETEALLLKKIEELTLYLIQKDQKEKEQEERIKKLEALVSKMTDNK